MSDQINLLRKLQAVAKAIEHAEYMAKSAERLIEAVNDLTRADSEHGDGQANESDVIAAANTISETLGTLRNRIYEFRKRRDRAAAQDEQPMPSNILNVLRRIRSCDNEAAAQVVLEYAMREHARAALSQTGYTDATSEQQALDRIIDALKLGQVAMYWHDKPIQANEIAAAMDDANALREAARERGK